MAISMDPGVIFKTWAEFKIKLEEFCQENKVFFIVSHGKTVEQNNLCMKKGPFFDKALKYTHIIMRCKHYGSYHSRSSGLRPKQKSYKINCRAFICLSACRKENHLIIRDSFHTHSHPCTEEIYNSYPEVRRLTKEERRMVGTLMDMGVAAQQIKLAVGKNITLKDLHNAKRHMRAVKLGLKSEDKKKRRSRADNVESHSKSTALEDNSKVPGSSGDGVNESLNSSEVEIALQQADQDAVSNDAPDLEASNSEEASVASKTNADHLYTVVVASDDVGISKSLNQLQELIEKHASNSVETSTVSTLSKADIMKKIEKDMQGGLVSCGPNKKCCESCHSFMPLSDGHSVCLTCLGPQHLYDYDCKFCAEMRPEQQSARRNALLRMRMKAFKNKNKKNCVDVDDFDPSDDYDMATPQRRSKRGRKPRNFGSDMQLDNFFSPRSTPTSQSANNRHNYFEGIVPKIEIEDDGYEDDISYVETSDSNVSKNTDRFNHLLRQSAVLDDVLITETDDRGLQYEPDVDSVVDINKVMSQKEMTGVPKELIGKYNLESQFESSYCSVPAAFDIPGDAVANSMGVSLRRLVQNAAVQTKLAVYDKLFTRLGENMADEALNIITQLYGKVTNVTEISQDDLTHNLQMALDTIQALKDVLQELGDMSKDSLTTASNQRKISLHSLERAKATLKMKRPATSQVSASPVKRSRFTPFTKQRINFQSEPDMEVDVTHGDNEVVEDIKPERVVVSTTNSNPDEDQPVVMEVSIPPDVDINDELLEQIRQQHKGVVEVNVVNKPT